MSAVLTAPRRVADPLRFTASDVTGMHTLEFDGVDGHRSAGDVAMSVAELMQLPTNHPYAVRDDENARMLAEEEALGSQIDPGAKLIVIPKAHLGLR